MKKALQKFSVALALLITSLALSACGSNEEDNTAEKVNGAWQIVSMEFVTIDENGVETTTPNDHMMQSQEWTFGDDGIQYVVNDGRPANDKYTYSISGNKMILTPIDNESLPVIEADIISIENKVMKMNYYSYGDKKDFIRYTFSRK